MERKEDSYERVLADLRAKKKRLTEMEISQLTQAELREYEYNLKVYRDLKNSIDTAYRQGVELGRAEVRSQFEKYKQGLEQGRIEGRIDVAKAMLKRGMDIKTISELSGLTEEEIKKL